MSAHIATSQRLDQVLDEQLERQRMDGVSRAAARRHVGQTLAMLLRWGVVKQEDVSPQWLVETPPMFIDKARAEYGTQHTYEKAVYWDVYTELTVTCRKHGDWQVTPYNYLYNRSGCPKCVVERVPLFGYGISTFIARAKAIHGDKYGYERAEYKGAYVRLTITCPTHGDWETTPVNHIQQRTGCPTCGGGGPHAAVDTASFIDKARAVHGDKYSYERAVYENSKTKLIVTCPKHGDWQVTPTSHIHAGSGCQRCGDRRPIRDIAPFVAKAKAVHGLRYIYERTAYMSTPT